MIADIFFAVGVLTVIAGGVLSAYGAKRPSRFRMWASAYLVLIAGAVQCGLAHGWRQLEEPHELLATLAFLFYNLGNLYVVLGTKLKGQSTYSFSLVGVGSGLLAAAMVLLLWSVHDSRISWTLGWFVALVLVVLVSMPVGLMLSWRRHK